MKRSEKSIETSINRKVKKRGGYSIKMQHTGQNGFPDRLYILPYIEEGFYRKQPTTVHVEFKQFGKDLDPLQKVWRKRLLGLGCYYYLINSKESYEKFCKLYSL